MKIARKSLIVFAIIVIVGFSVYFNFYSTQKEVVPSITIDGATWSQALYWDFKDGFYPKGWFWGEWNIADGTLEGRDPSGKFCVYFFPFTHGGDFILETRAMFIQGTADLVNAQLLTRDSNKLNFESGMITFVEENRITVRHMADKINRVYETFYIDMNMSYGEWYVMRFMVYEGRVKAFANALQVYSSNSSYPVGEYHEPHLAVQYGVARFEYVKIFILEGALSSQSSLECKPSSFSCSVTSEIFKRADSQLKKRMDTLSDGASCFLAG